MVRVIEAMQIAAAPGIVIVEAHAVTVNKPFLLLLFAWADEIGIKSSDVRFRPALILMLITKFPDSHCQISDLGTMRLDKQA